MRAGKVDIRGEIVIGACLSLLVRRASRAVAQLYDEALNPARLTNGQFTMLAQIVLRQPVTVAALAQALDMDRTTLTRNLRHLSERGAISETVPPGDRRKRMLDLTSEGEALLVDALPRWTAAQTHMELRLGHSDWTAALRQLRSLLDELRTPKRRSVVRPRARVETSLHGILGADEIMHLRSHLCMCTVLRQCARATSKPYDEGLREHRQRISQFHLLAALEAMPGVRIASLIDILTLDQSTLSRMVQHMIKLGLARHGDAKGKRGELFSTDRGRRAFETSWKAWKQTQDKLSSVVAAAGERSLFEQLIAAASQRGLVHQAA